MTSFAGGVGVQPKAIADHIVPYSSDITNAYMLLGFDKFKCQS